MADKEKAHVHHLVHTHDGGRVHDHSMHHTHWEDGRVHATHHDHADDSTVKADSEIHAQHHDADIPGEGDERDFLASMYPGMRG